VERPSVSIRGQFGRVLATDKGISCICRARGACDSRKVEANLLRLGRLSFSFAFCRLNITFR
jgi:hypothetical protein